MKTFTTILSFFLVLHFQSVYSELRNTDGSQVRYPDAATLKTGNERTVQSYSRGIKLVQKGCVPGSLFSLNNANSIDFDRDGNLEFICCNEGMFANIVRVYECAGDNTFNHVSTTSTFSVSIYPTEIGDADNDGLLELLIFGCLSESCWVRVYEQNKPKSYPADCTFEIVTQGEEWATGARIEDLDKDGVREIIHTAQGNNGGYFSVYENTGDNSFKEVFNDSTKLNYFCGVQAFTSGFDFDNDGKLEALIGGYPKLLLYENNGDNSYTRVWEDSTDMNVANIINTIDIDNDGYRDFLCNVGSLFTLYEMNEEGEFKPAWQESVGNGEGEVIVCDLDQDGIKELAVQIVSENYIDTRVMEVLGDNMFTNVWSKVTQIESTCPYYVTAGIVEYDLDQDGRKELLFNDYLPSSTEMHTMIFEYEDATPIAIKESTTSNRMQIIPTVNSVRISLYDKPGSNAKINIYSFNGKLIKSLPAEKNVIWDRSDSNGRKVSNGCYIARFITDSQISVKSFIL